MGKLLPPFCSPLSLSLSLSFTHTHSHKHSLSRRYVHEKIACGSKAPLQFTRCKRSLPLIGSWSIATEDCLPFVSKNFRNYGQCDNIAMRASSPWWHDHTKSFAMRQISTYERNSMGWVFDTYKMDIFILAPLG